MKFTRSRAWLIGGIVAFVAAFQWVYVSWLWPTFGYWGFQYEVPSPRFLVLAWVLSVLPALWLPLNIHRPSQLICWVLYLVVVIPSMFVPLYLALQEPERIAVLMLVLTVGFAIVSAGATVRTLKLRKHSIPAVAFWTGFSVVGLGLAAWVVAVFYRHFRLVGFNEIYQSLRFSGHELAAGTGVSYAIMWLSGAFVPLLMAWGLARRRPWFFAIGAGIQVMLYGTVGLKSNLVCIVVMPVLYFLLRSGGPPFALKLTWLTVLGFVGLNTFNLMVGELGESHLMLSALVFMRTFGISGLSTAQYHDFFTDHPVTAYSHVNGINWFVDYPYQTSLGREVGYYYSRNIELNSNAHLWCMDGLAGFGLPGILLISVLCAVVFWLLDSAAAGHDRTFTALAVTFAALNLSNVSLFTSLLSGGLWFLILMLFLLPRERTVAAFVEPMQQEDEPDSGDEIAAIPASRPLGVDACLRVRRREA